MMKQWFGSCWGMQSLTLATKFRTSSCSPLALRLLKAKNVFMEMPKGPKDFRVIHAFQGSYTHAATRAISA